MTYNEFATTHKPYNQEESNARRLLVERGFITETDVLPFYIRITGKGLLFLNQGGFQKEEELKNLPLDNYKVSKQAKTISIIAIIMSALAFLAQIFFR